MKRIKVVCAMISMNNRLLVVQRSESMSLPLKWELPGGKLERNESELDCILREIKEELDIEIHVTSRLTPSNFDYPNISIQLIPFLAEYVRGNIKLVEHKQYILLEKEELENLDWADADIPIVKEYLKL